MDLQKETKILSRLGQSIVHKPSGRTGIIYDWTYDERTPTTYTI